MSNSYFSLNSQIENKAPLNNLTSHISNSYIKWETRNGKWETRSGKWEIRNLEVGYGKGLNWAPRNGKWEPNQNSRLWRFALCTIPMSLFLPLALVLDSIACGSCRLVPPLQCINGSTVKMGKVSLTERPRRNACRKTAFHSCRGKEPTNDLWTHAPPCLINWFFIQFHKAALKEPSQVVWEGDEKVVFSFLPQVDKIQLFHPTSQNLERFF